MFFIRCLHATVFLPPGSCPLTRPTQVLLETLLQSSTHLWGSLLEQVLAVTPPPGGGLNWPRAPSLLCSSSPPLQAATTWLPSVSHFFNLQQVPPPAWLFIKLSIPHHSAETLPSSCPSLTRDSQSKSACLKTCLHLFPGFCLFLHPQSDWPGLGGALSWEGVGEKSL